MNSQKLISIKETTLFKVAGNVVIPTGTIINIFIDTMIIYNKELWYLEDGVKETHFMPLSEWREKQINSILEDE